MHVMTERFTIITPSRNDRGPVYHMLGQSGVLALICVVTLVLAQ